MLCLLCLFFFFVKQKTAYEISECDWSSDVCSSDLRSRRGAAEGNDPLLRTFTEEPDQPPAQIDISERQRRHLSDPGPRAVHQLENCAVPTRGRIGSLHRIEQARHLSLGERFWNP